MSINSFRSNPDDVRGSEKLLEENILSHLKNLLGNLFPGYSQFGDINGLSRVLSRSVTRYVFYFDRRRSLNKKGTVVPHIAINVSSKGVSYYSNIQVKPNSYIEVGSELIELDVHGRPLSAVRRISEIQTQLVESLRNLPWPEVAEQ